MIPCNHLYTGHQRHLQPLTWRIQTWETWRNSLCRWWSSRLHSVRALWKWKRQAAVYKAQNKWSWQAVLVINRTCEISASLWGIRVSVRVVAQNGKSPEICKKRKGSHVGLLLYSTGHQALISQVPVLFKHTPVLIPDGESKDSEQL